MALPILLTVVIGYFLGNLNGSVLISRLLQKDDVRRHGSGNAGFTNFFRSYGGTSSLFVIVIDAVKAVAACLIGGWLLGRHGFRLEGTALAGLAVSLGHDFPALFHFQGGKGIVCGFAVILTIDWRMGLLVGLTFLVVYLLTQYVSLASVSGAVCYGLCFLIAYRTQPIVMALGLAMAALAIFMHRTNIVRLLNGTESKTNFFKRGH